MRQVNHNAGQRSPPPCLFALTYRCNARTLPLANPPPPPLPPPPPPPPLPPPGPPPPTPLPSRVANFQPGHVNRLQTVRPRRRDRCCIGRQCHREQQQQRHGLAARETLASLALAAVGQQGRLSPHSCTATTSAAPLGYQKDGRRRCNTDAHAELPPAQPTWLRNFRAQLGCLIHVAYLLGPASRPRSRARLRAARTRLAIAPCHQRPGQKGPLKPLLEKSPAAEVRWIALKRPSKMPRCEGKAAATTERRASAHAPACAPSF